MKLLIARHGNTFGPQDTPTRVGLKTDIPLVEKGWRQAQALGQYLKSEHLIPNTIYCSALQRTRQTAEGIIETLDSNYSIPIIENTIFNEIDYGVDENKTEEEVIARIGKQAIEDWDRAAIVPDGWQVQPELLKQHWQSFADDLIKENKNKTNKIHLVVTSNGIARFAPVILADQDRFLAKNNIKIATGALCLFEYIQDSWQAIFWNQRPFT